MACVFQSLWYQLWRWEIGNLGQSCLHVFESVCSYASVTSKHRKMEIDVNKWFYILWQLWQL